MLQVWTYKGRVAFVLSVLEKNKPVQDCVKLQRLRQIMLDIMGGDLGSVVIDQVLLLYPQSQEAYIRSHNTLSVSLHH